MLRKILLALAGALVVFVILVATRSDSFHLERSTRIDAPADVVFAQVNDFKNWDAWSPWAKLDPNMTDARRRTVGRVGATTPGAGGQVGEATWRSSSMPNGDCGEAGVRVPPFAGTNADVHFVPQASATNVVGDGRRPQLHRQAIGLFWRRCVPRPAIEQGLAQ